MNTAAKGNFLEDSVFNIIQYLLQNDRLKLSPTQTKLFRKKSYPSRKQNINVVATDISIELWPPQAANYSTLWVCVYKNYDHVLPLSDLEDFKIKLNQIGGNIKGVIASGNALQHEALDFARTNGIGVIRILPNDRVRWVIEKSNMASDGREEKANAREITTGLTSQNYTGQNHNLYAFYDGYTFDNLNGFLSRMLK